MASNQKKFNFNMAKDVSNIGSVSEELRKVEAKNVFDFRVIPIEKIKVNELNDYPMEEIEELMMSIKNVEELIHNFKVKQVDEFFVLISGERRYRAILLGIEKGYEEFDIFKNYGLPCMLTNKNINEVDEEIQIIVANEEIRKNDAARSRKKIGRLYELYEMKNIKDGVDRSITKQIAESIGKGERQIQRINAVNKKLIPSLQKALDESKINLEKAAELAAMDEEAQQLVANLFEENNEVSKKELAAIMSQAKEAEEKLRLHKEEEEKIRREYDNLSRQLDEMRDEIDSQKEKEDELREKLSSEMESNSPDKRRVLELEAELNNLKKQKEEAEAESKRMKAALQSNEKEQEEAKRRLEKERSNLQEISLEDKEKIKLGYEINSLISDISWKLNELSSVGKEFVKKYNGSIEGIDGLKINAERTLRELKEALDNGN